MSNAPPSYPPQPPGGVPAPPPRVNLKQLWFSLLLPPVFAFLVMLVFFLLPERVFNDGDVLFTATSLIALSIIVGWVLLIRCLKGRLRGPSFVLPVVGYPLLQAGLAFAIFFAGCFAIITKDGQLYHHGPPSSVQSIIEKESSIGRSGDQGSLSSYA